MKSESRIIGNHIDFNDLQDGDFLFEAVPPFSYFYVLKKSNEIVYVINAIGDIISLGKTSFIPLVLVDEKSNDAVKEFREECLGKSSRLSFEQLESFVNGQKLWVYMKVGLTYVLKIVKINKISPEYVEFGELQYPESKHNFSRTIFGIDCIVFAIMEDAEIETKSETQVQDAVKKYEAFKEKCPSHDSCNDSADSVSYALRGIDPVEKSPNEDAIREVMGAMTDLLIEKNRRYGDSAITPKNIFSRASSEEGILLRIDDKLSRVMNGKEVRLNDVCDLIGYETLLLIARKTTRQDILNLID
jgi:hypothetical protein